MSTPYRYIFLADDDDDDIFLFKEALLQHKEVVVESFNNGSDVLKRITETSILPDLIFLDLNMPEMSGKECLQKIRADKRTQELPVIIYSTSSNKKDIDDTFGMGANLYVIKPNTFKELKLIILKLMSTELKNHPPGIDNFVFKA